MLGHQAKEQLWLLLGRAGSPAFVTLQKRGQLLTLYAEAGFLFKTSLCFLPGDDDTFVNPKALTDYLRQTPGASRVIHGNIQNHSVVIRGGKYAVPHAVYPLPRYPNFASGGGFIMPGPLIPALCKASLQLPVFPLDDVYMGFLTLAAGLSHQHDSRFRVWGPPRDERMYTETVTVHGLSLEKMEQVWQKVCSQQKENV